MLCFDFPNSHDGLIGTEFTVPAVRGEVGFPIFVFLSQVQLGSVDHEEGSDCDFDKKGEARSDVV